MSTHVIRRVLWIALAVAVLGQVARADEIDVFTVRELTVPGFIPLTNVPTTDVIWLILGPFEIKDETSFIFADEEWINGVNDIFDLFRINPVPGETSRHEPFFDCTVLHGVGSCSGREFRIEYPTTLPLGIDLSSTVEIPESPEPTATPEPATLGLLGSGMVMLAWRIRRKARKSSEEMTS
ncbi:MAG: PEP-CTERM sorting domain-containing protein [Candidatus Acidiferrales bacterium]